MKLLNTRLIIGALAGGILLVAIPPMPAFAQTTQAVAATEPDTPPQRSAMLGVSVTVPPAGDGLRVDFVLPNSPAAEVGIQVGDVLLQFDDQILFNPEQLQKLVERAGIDHEVKLICLRGTEQAVRTCRPAALADPARFEGESSEAIKKILKDAGVAEGNVAALSFVRIGDPGNAILQLSRMDNGWNLSIRDQAGKELFSGPFNTEADRAAVPEKYRSMLPLLYEVTK